MTRLVNQTEPEGVYIGSGLNDLAMSKSAFHETAEHFLANKASD